MKKEEEEGEGFHRTESFMPNFASARLCQRLLPQAVHGLLRTRKYPDWSSAAIILGITYLSTYIDRSGCSWSIVSSRFLFPYHNPYGTTSRGVLPD